MQPLQTNFGPLLLRLATTGYLRLDEAPGNPIGAVGGELVNRWAVGGGVVLFVDHRSRTREPFRVELWVPDAPAEGNLLCVCVTCDARDDTVSTGGLPELERMIRGVEQNVRRLRVPRGLRP